MKKILMAIVVIAAMTSIATERRMVWTRPYAVMDSGDGDFDKAAARMKECGITDVLCVITDGMSAFYKSKVLQPVVEYKNKSIETVEPMIKAFHKQGIRLHAWMAIGRLGRTESEYIEQMKKEGRLAININGEVSTRFICREDPRNTQAYVAAAAELIALGIDGIHLDYIRYDHWADCYCEHMKKMYAEHGGKRLDGWPKSVDANVSLDWQWVEARKTAINNIVKAMHQEVRKHKNVEFSAAVFHPASTTKALLGQDWSDWIKKDWFDFLCPMVYSSDLESVRRELIDEMQIIAGAKKTKIYPGLAVEWSGGNNKAREVANQINLSRVYMPGGFVLFHWSPDTVGRIETVLLKK